MIEIKIKYLDGATKLKRIQQGDWIDVYAYEDVILHQGESALVSLGFAMEFPAKYEAHLAPRSSTFKKWGVIQTNSVGVIDNSYCGDNDIWRMPVYCLAPRHSIGDVPETINGLESVKVKSNEKVTIIKKGDKIGQFRLIERMNEEIKFNEVEHLGNEDRGGFGSTGSK